MSTPVDLRPNEKLDTPVSPPPAPQGARKNPEDSQTIWESVKEIVRYALIAAVIIIPIRIFIAQPFIVSGKSMYPTFKNGEYLIVDELTKRLSGYERGDVVILRYPNDPSEFYIKRLIGLPGETVTIDNGKVSVTKTDGTVIALDEPYVKNPKILSQTRKLSDAEYFVMGDNRAQSSDSSVWGPVPARDMDGKALMRLFPISAIEYRPGAVEKFTSSFESPAP